MKNQGKTSRKIPKRKCAVLGESANLVRKHHQKSIKQKSQQYQPSCTINECIAAQIEEADEIDFQDDIGLEKRQSEVFSTESSIGKLEKPGSFEDEDSPEDTDLSEIELNKDPVSERGENNGQDDASASDTSEDAGGKKREVKHIHPCICDLSATQKHRIRQHVEKTKKFESRLVERLEEIDLERSAIEEELRRKEQEALEQQELFGDQYEVIGKKKKRLKRSARRASMVSLGVKQVINWRRSPRIKVKQNKVSELRKNHTSYCGEKLFQESPIKKISFETSPKIPVRITKTTALRTEANFKKKEDLLKREDKRPRFIVAPPV